MKFEYFNFDKLNDKEGVRIPVPQCYRDCIKLAQSDYYRVYGKTASLLKIWFTSFRNHSIQYLLWMRLSSFRKSMFFPFCAWRREHYKKKYGLDIPNFTKIGWGFYIGHGIAIVINGTAIIGNNVNIGQCCTIGSNNGHAAIIGDNVYIGPNTCIIEDVQIGSNTIIGAGSVVTKTIEGGCTAVGSPCKVIGENQHPEFVQKRWEYKNN
jgi:serine O-acetyltransferase